MGIARNPHSDHLGWPSHPLVPNGGGQATPKHFRVGFDHAHLGWPTTSKWPILIFFFNMGFLDFSYLKKNHMISMCGPNSQKTQNF
jgi:hypothetical protein